MCAAANTDSAAKKASARTTAVAVAAKLLTDRADDGSAEFYAFTPSPPGGPAGAYQVRPDR